MAVQIMDDKNFEKRVLRLCDLLRNETDVCRELLELSKAEQKYLMKNDIDNLMVNTDRMKSAVEILKNSQNSRHKCMDSLASELDVQINDMTIRSISNNIRTSLSDKLKKSSRELMKIGERLYRTNHNTVYLIDFSLDLLDQQNKLWAELVSDKDESYSIEGRKGEPQTYPLIVEKKV